MWLLYVPSFEDSWEILHAIQRRFCVGAAAAAYQIEGAASEGGRKPSVWDDYCDRPDAVKQGHSGGCGV